jgi:hypothetical protein
MRIISVILLLSLCFQFLFKKGVAGYYFANKDYIARVLCINRENTAMHCDGKCYLKKKMQEAGDETPQSASRIKYEPIEFLTSLPAELALPVAVESSISWSFSPGQYTLLYSGSVFHPPC